MSTTQKLLEDHVKELADQLNVPFADWDQELAEDPEYGFTALDYIQDALDITYTFNSQRELIGATLLVAYGGPNIYIDLNDGYVKGSWGYDEARAPFGGENVQDLLEALGDLFHC